MKKIRQRYLQAQVVKDLHKKMVFQGEPRQVGKTSLAESLLKSSRGHYLNWDYDNDRDKILAREWPSGGGAFSARRNS